jgi:integrase/recombinase XerD
VLSIRHGKGDKDRFVPIGERTTAWVRKYMIESRPKLMVYGDERAVFLSARGDRISDHYLTQLVAKAIDEAGIGKSGGGHLFRHTAATLMLEGGADIRFIQQMLGHASVKTTQVYMRVSLHQLKAVHEATHPGARLKKEAAKEEKPSEPRILLDDQLSR